MNEVQENSILLRLHQYYGDYRILNSDLLVHIENGIITTINGSYYSSIDNLENFSLLSESEIVQIAETEPRGLPARVNHVVFCLFLQKFFFNLFKVWLLELVCEQVEPGFFEFDGHNEVDSRK